MKTILDVFFLIPAIIIGGALAWLTGGVFYELIVWMNPLVALGLVAWLTGSIWWWGRWQ